MSEYNNLFNLFKEIQDNEMQLNRFTVVAIEKMQHRLGRSQEGYPKFFVHTDNSTSTVQNVIREILSVEYSVPCELVDNNGNHKNDNYTIITLRSQEKGLQSYFIDIFTMMLKKMSQTPSKRELSIEVEKLITIFSALSNPPKKKIQGLWSELLVIEQSLNPEILISAWHSSPTAKYDFTMGHDKIEVKSTSSEERIHKFSLDQRNPSPSSRLIIASTIVRESAPTADGLSVRNLYDKICTRVTDINSRLHLYTIIAETIGTDLVKLDTVYFDYTSAVDYLGYYDAMETPHIDKNNVPEFVTDVKFASNLTHLTDVRSPESHFNYSDSILFKSLL